MPLPLPSRILCRSRKRAPGVARELAATLAWDRVGAYHAEEAVLVATCAYAHTRKFLH